MDKIQRGSCISPSRDKLDDPIKSMALGVMIIFFLVVIPFIIINTLNKESTSNFQIIELTK
jgi:hypothetical protein